MGLVDDGSKFDPFYDGLVRKGGPREKRVYKVALMGEFDYRKPEDKPKLSRHEVHDLIDRQRKTAAPLIPFKIPEPNKASLPPTVDDDGRPNTSMSTVGSTMGRHFRSPTRRPRNTVLGEDMSGSVDSLGTSMASLRPYSSNGKDLMGNPSSAQDRHPTQHVIEPIIIPPVEDTTNRDPFHAVRIGGPKQKRLFHVALMGEYNKPQDKKKLSRNEVEEWVKRSGEENARKQRPEETKEFLPFQGVRTGGPKEKRLYRTAMMGEYDYRKTGDMTELKDTRKKRDPFSLEMPPMPGFEPFDGVRRFGPKEKRLYNLEMMGEYDYRRTKDITVMEALRIKKYGQN
jgi:hypothetical protein